LKKRERKKYLKILILDKSFIDCDLIKDFLSEDVKNDGWIIEDAPNLDKGILKLKENYDLIMLDKNFSQESAPETLLKIKMAITIALPSVIIMADTIGVDFIKSFKGQKISGFLVKLGLTKESVLNEIDKIIIKIKK